MNKVWLATLWVAACGKVSSPSDTGDDDSPPGTDETPEDTVRPGDDSVPAVLPTDTTRSGAMVLAGDDKLLVADTDNGDVLVLDMVTGTSTPVSAGAEPTRLVRSGATVWVVLRQAGEVVRFAYDGNTLVEEGRVHVGAEPFDIAVGPSGTRLYVALSMENAVVALDRDTLLEVGRWDVPNEPRWLTPTTTVTGGEALFVASARGKEIRKLDVDTGTIEIRPLPRLRVSPERGCEEVTLNVRVTGDMAIDASGEHLYVPALYVNPFVPAIPGDEVVETGLFLDDEPADVDDTDQPCPIDPSRPQPRPEPTTQSGAYGGISMEPGEPPKPAQVGRFNPALVELSLMPGEPDVATALGTMVTVQTQVEEGVSPRTVPARSYVQGVELDEDPLSGRKRAFLTMESMSTLVAVNLGRKASEPGLVDFIGRPRVAGYVAAGPSIARWQYGEFPTLWIWSWLDRSVTAYSPTGIDAAFEGPSQLPAASVALRVGPSELPQAVQRGRNLFFRSDLRTMASNGTGVTCAGCHPDARSDGFTWVFPDFPRQTPSLAGAISQTSPVTWTGEVSSPGHEAELTVSLRMGGRGITPEQAVDVQAFLDWGRDVVLPPPDAEEQALIADGREIFNRPEVGCAACHGGPRGTSAVVVPIFGLPAVNPPGLVGLTATAPYLHDGSAATLRDVLERSRDGSMGDTSSLSNHELDALEAYLTWFDR